MVVSRDPEHVAEPVTIERLAELPLILYDAQFGADDPMRRQLVERAQRAGVTLGPSSRSRTWRRRSGSPRAGIGDTVVSRAVLRDGAGSAALHVASFVEPIWDTFAFIARRDAPLSPATRAFVELVERRLERVGEISLYRTATSGVGGAVRTLPRVLSPAVDNLVAQLTRLPGIGTRTAQRLAFHLLSGSRRRGGRARPRRSPRSRSACASAASAGTSPRRSSAASAPTRAATAR